MKGNNICCNIHTIIDLIEYSDYSNIPGSIVLLDIEKAFDCDEHGFLFEVLTRFNFGDNFIQWVKTFNNKRKSYVINNDLISSSINMSRGIFQGCPISPFLFLYAIEVLVIAMMISKGFKWATWKKKSVFWLMIPPVFAGRHEVFSDPFNSLDQFASFSGCKVNMSKSEAIHIGSLTNSDVSHFRIPASSGGPIHLKP